MALFKPCKRMDKMIEITPDLLSAVECSALLLDIDNTMTTHNNPVPADGVVEWIAGMKAAGFKIIIVSNNNGERVRKFSELVGLDFEGAAKKPLPFGFKRACKRLRIQPEKAAVVGDQIFTDILGGNLMGAYTILTVPYQPESSKLFKIKRFFERVVMRFWNN